MRRLSELGEVGLLAELERRGLAVEISNDAFALAGTVLSKDLLVERVHFRLDWTSWRDLGYKAAAVNLSDLAATGAEPRGLLVGVALPAETDLEAVLELYEGLNEPGVPVVGGDTTRNDTVVLSVTAVGQAERPVERSGAEPGDALVVTGALGGAAAGLHVLREGLVGFDDLVRAYRRPPVRTEEGRKLAPAAHALIDISDGILADAARIAERSACRLVIDVERLPVAARIAQVADLPFWTMGEDYELLAALAPEDAEASGFPIVGRCEEGWGVEPDFPAGWDSFR